MRFFKRSIFHFVILAAPFWPTLAVAAPVLTITTDKPGGLYAAGEKITWNIRVTGDDAAPVKEATYVLKRGGATVIDHGTLVFKEGAATIEISPDGPCTILAVVTLPPVAPGQKGTDALAGAAVSPEKIERSSPCPEDFDAFWKAKIAELAAVPENAVLEKGESGRAGVDYWKITMNNIRGTHIEGQVARPSDDAKCPAIVVFQWAGIYPLEKSWAVDLAAKGWLVLNVNPHDLPIDQPQAFYDDVGKTTLKNYTAINNDDREKSYFLRMFLGCYRSVGYLSKRADWDGRTLVAAGTSQGGLQTFVAAGLNPKVTAMMVMVPAGCDNTGALVGRGTGWPYWLNNFAGKDKQKVTDTSRYFDAVNFAARVRCPALVGVGLIDVTATPSAVYTAFNQLQGPKEMVVMSKSDHQGHGNTQAPYIVRSEEWKAALLKGQAAPVPR